MIRVHLDSLLLHKFQHAWRIVKRIVYDSTTAYSNVGIGPAIGIHIGSSQLVQDLVVVFHHSSQ
jgi:hypothetical protein